MGFFDKALTNFGYERVDHKSTTLPNLQNKDYTTPSDAASSIMGANSWNPAFSSFNNERQQLMAYRDWVYIAAKMVADQSAAIDLRLFLNRGKLNNMALSQKLIEFPKEAALYANKKVTYLETKGGQIKIQKGVTALEELDNHPLLDLLNNPNASMSKNEFLEICFLHLELTGNAYWFVVRDKKKKPIELWPLLPNLVAVVPDQKHFIVGYVYTTNGKQIPLNPEDVVHHKYGNPMDFRHGYSAVMAGSTTIDGDTHAAIFNQRFFYNTAMPDGFLTTDEQIDEKVFKRLKDEWMNTYGGAVNSHRTAILSGGLQFKNLQINQRDMEFLKGRNFNRDMILSLFGVPKSLAGFDESMSRANADTAEYIFSKRIRIRMQRLVNRITMDLAPDYENGENLLVSFTDPVPQDTAQVLKDNVSSLGTTNNPGFATINEIRARRGDLPVAGGNQIFVPANLLPLGAVSAQPVPSGRPADVQEDPSEARETSNEMEESDEGGDTPDAQDTAGSTTSTGLSTGVPDSGSAASDATSAVRSISKPVEKVKVDSLPAFPKPIAQVESRGDSDFLVTEPEKAQANKPKPKYTLLFTKQFVTENYLKERQHTADVFEVRFMRASKLRFEQQKGEVLNNVSARFMFGTKALQKATKKENKNKLNDLFDPVASLAAWKKDMVPIYKGTTTSGGSLGAKLINDPEGYGYNAPAPAEPVDYRDVTGKVDKYFQQHTDIVFEGVDSETTKQLRASLNEGINASETTQELADRVENVYGAAIGYRAERIAITEANRALQYSNFAVWQDSGMVDSYIWKTASDPCPKCIPYADMVRQSPGDFPEEHPHGRCAVIPFKLKDLSEVVG
jgi:HK97 family phage portal protein